LLIAAVLGSALLHAAWNALLRGHPDKRAGGVAVVAIGAVIAAITACVAVAVTGRAPFPGGAGLVATLIAGIFEAGYLISLSRGLAVGTLGPVYTVSRGGSLLVVWPLSVALFGEHVGAFSIAGTVVLLGGLIVTGMEQGVPKKALAWAISTAACIAGYHLVYKVALDAGAMPPAVFAVAIGLAVPVQAAVQRVGPRGALAAIRVQPAATIGAGILCTASFIVFLIALRASGAGSVLILRNTSVVFALGFGALIGDRPSRRQITGAVLVAIGAVLVGLQCPPRRSTRAARTGTRTRPGRIAGGSRRTAPTSAPGSPG
jgi:drug/metabolite transporter (DMT)-like permease